MTFVCQPARSIAPHTPRIILIGSLGSGRSVQASLLANKYRIIDGEGDLLHHLFPATQLPSIFIKLHLFKYRFFSLPSVT